MRRGSSKRGPPAPELRIDARDVEEEIRRNREENERFQRQYSEWFERQAAARKASKRRA